jgi:hypothetical protein
VNGKVESISKIKFYIGCDKCLLTCSLSILFPVYISNSWPVEALCMERNLHVEFQV